jgi:hypothetical protein
LRPRAARLTIVFLLLLLGLAQGLGTTSALAEDVAALITAAQGTYPASQLPLMCVSIHQATATPAQNLALLQKLGAGCARSDIVWDSIERVGSAGSYQWGEFDDFWSTLCRAGIKPIMIVTYNNPIYAAGVFRPVAGGVNIAAFKNFAVATANHYISICPNMIEELFNEPNAINWTTVPWSGASYALMLAPVSAAIKAAQPRVTVYSGGLGFDPGPESMAWIKQMVGAGQRFSSVDAYAFHPYDYDENTPDKTLPPEQLLIDAGLFAKAAASTGQGKPVVLTEYGFPLQALGGDLMKQGIYTARGMLAAIIGQYPLYTYYDLIDDGTDYANRENTFGLFRNGSAMVPYEIKPAGKAFAAIMDAMAKAKTYSIAYDAAIMATTISFEKAAGTSLVVWTYDSAATKSYTRPIGSFRQVSCKDVLGKTYPCSYSSASLSIELTEAKGPVVVTALK